MGHVDFTLKMDIFLPKNNIEESTSTLKAQKLLNYT